MRLIDADALGVGEANRDVFIVPEYADGWNSAIKMIKNAPTVDAVPVVRCGECGHHEKLPEEIDPDICYNPNPFGSEKRIFCRKLGFVVSEDFYCKHGERGGK